MRRHSATAASRPAALLVGQIRPVLSLLAPCEPGALAPSMLRRIHEMDSRLWKAVGRGVRRRCPNCGSGHLFSGWFTLRRDCPVCRLVYLRDAGDTWFFWIIMDRIPIAVGLILVIFFGLRVSSWVGGVVFLSAMIIPLIATMPHREGVAIALNYISRLYFRDPSDVLPAWRAEKPQRPGTSATTVLEGGRPEPRHGRQPGSVDEGLPRELAEGH